MKKKMFTVFFTIALENGDKIDDNMKFLADDIFDVARKVNGYYLPLESNSKATGYSAENITVQAGLGVPNMWINSIMENSMIIVPKNISVNAID